MTELSKTFCLWPDYAEKMIKTGEDQKFLESMKTDKVATFGCFDVKLSQQARHKEIGSRIKKGQERRMVNSRKTNNKGPVGVQH